MKTKLLFIVFLFFGNIVFSQEDTLVSKDIKITPLIEGTLLLPDSTQTTPLVIFIAGSGPTDRDGNQLMMKNNSLKFTAEALYGKGISSFRFDKRIFKQLQSGSIKEEEIDFDDFIEDAKAVLAFFKNDKRFSKLIFAGHSQGSLVGMIAAQEGADGFISLAGAGQEIDDVIIDQLSSQAPHLVEAARVAFDDLRVYGFVENFNPALSSILRPSVQPFINSWMQYNPQEEIKKLTIPVLLINGDTDLQVAVSEAEKLKEAYPQAKLVIIKNMNHIFKQIKHGDLVQNQQSYSNPELPISSKLINELVRFIKQ